MQPKRSTVLLSLLGALAAVAVLLAALAVTPGAPVRAQTEEPTAPSVSTDRFVTVLGQGSVTAAPDQVTVRLGVTNEAMTATAALEQNRATVTDVLSATTGLDVPEENIQTQVLQLQPVREDTQQLGPLGPTGDITGYTAQSILSITVDDIDSVGDVIDAAVGAGANTVENINFSVSDRDALLATARDQALQDARAKAEAFADALGVTLGPVLVIREQGTGGIPSPVVREDAAFAAGGGFPVQPGQQTLDVAIEVSWALEGE